MVSIVSCHFHCHRSQTSRCIEVLPCHCHQFRVLTPVVLAIHPGCGTATTKTAVGHRNPKNRSTSSNGGGNLWSQPSDWDAVLICRMAYSHAAVLLALRDKAFMTRSSDELGDI